MRGEIQINNNNNYYLINNRPGPAARSSRFFPRYTNDSDPEPRSGKDAKHLSYYAGCRTRAKGQIVIIGLWILIILSVLAVSIGYRVSLALRLSSFQKESLKSLYLAKAGINRAIVEINRDLTQIDSLTDNWAVNEDIFKKIAIEDESPEFASVSYINKNGEEVFGVIDEERRININTVGQELLAGLLEKGGLPPDQSELIAANIRAWRSSLEIVPAEARNYSDLGYESKGQPFTNYPELALVKGITPELYRNLRGLLTVHGSGGININTAGPGTLELIIAAGMKKAKISDQAKLNRLLSAILKYRQDQGSFTDEDMANLLVVLGLSPYDYGMIVDELRKNLVVQSNIFRIIAKGRIAASKPERQIECVYDRENGKVVFWHES